MMLESAHQGRSRSLVDRDWLGVSLAAAIIALSGYWLFHYSSLITTFNGPTNRADAIITDITKRGCSILDHCVSGQGLMFDMDLRFTSHTGELVTAVLTVGSPYWKEDDRIAIDYVVTKPTRVTHDVVVSKRFWRFRQFGALAVLFIGLGFFIHQWLSPRGQA